MFVLIVNMFCGDYILFEGGNLEVWNLPYFNISYIREQSKGLRLTSARLYLIITHQVLHY